MEREVLLQRGGFLMPIENEARTRKTGLRPTLLIITLINYFFIIERRGRFLRGFSAQVNCIVYPLSVRRTMQWVS